MNLHFAPFDRACEVTRLPGDLAVLLVGIAGRQAASPTALVQARLTPAMTGVLLHPFGGAFHAVMAAHVVIWRQA